MAEINILYHNEDQERFMKLSKALADLGHNPQPLWIGLYDKLYDSVVRGGLPGIWHVAITSQGRGQYGTRLAQAMKESAGPTLLFIYTGDEIPETGTLASKGHGVVILDPAMGAEQAAVEISDRIERFTRSLNTGSPDPAQTGTEVPAPPAL